MRRLAPAMCSVVLLAGLTAVPWNHAPARIGAVPTAVAPWLDRLNTWRLASGLSTLTENTTWSSGDHNHAVYMVKNGIVAHSEDPTKPYYTTSGNFEAGESNIEVSSSASSSDAGAIDWWMGAPFHGMGMMDPRLTTVGFGADHDSTTSPWQSGWALDVLQGNPFTGGAYPVYFPGNGTTEPLTQYSGNEFPDPLAACGGYTVPTGLPLFVQVGGFTETTAANTTLIRTSDNASLALCQIDTRYSPTHDMLYDRGGVIIIPRNPLQTGQHYQVATTVNGILRTWGFTVGPLSARPSAPQNVTAVAGDSTATLTWTAPATDGGLAITSYTITPYIGTTAQAPQTVSAPALTATVTGLADGTSYWFTVAATNGNGTGPPATTYSVTPTSLVAPPLRQTTSALAYYSLRNSDGTTWQDMDAANLSLSVAPASDTVAIVTGNVDLWTETHGYNQDIGIWMSPTAATGGIVAWKESGGMGGTYSPNAAAVQAVVPLTHGVTYSFKLDWKTNIPALGATIHGGAGPLPVGGTMSPARLTIQLVPAASVTSVVSGQNYALANSDGSTWQTMDGTNLVASVSPAADGTALVSANADMFTSTKGYNQDLAVFVSVNGGADQMVVWKESGGIGAINSPNAAYAQGTYDVKAGSHYVFKVKWKTNRSASGATISAGGGPWGGGYSPTRLTVLLVSSANAWHAASGVSYHLTSSDGATWVAMDPSHLTLTIAPGTSESVVLGGNSDLFTAKGGYNQDIAILVSVNGGAEQLVAWKESGGLSGTFSPNAAFVQAVYPMTAGNTYVFTLAWKTNKSAVGATIYAGAGPWGGSLSPTSLIATVLT